MRARSWFLAARLMAALLGMILVPHVALAQADDQPGSVDTLKCEDADCFIQQAQDCSSSDWVNTLELGLTPLAPVVQSTTTAYHMEPADEGGCTLTLSYLANRVRYTDEYVTQALAQGMSQADLDAAQARLTQRAEGVTKVHYTCTFPPDDVVAMLTRWQAGSFSSSDLAAPNCAQQID